MLQKNGKLAVMDFENGNLPGFYVNDSISSLFPLFTIFTLKRPTPSINYKLSTINFKGGSTL